MLSSNKTSVMSAVTIGESTQAVRETRLIQELLFHALLRIDRCSKGIREVVTVVQFCSRISNGVYNTHNDLHMVLEPEQKETLFETRRRVT